MGSADYIRFAEDARRVMKAANQQAQRVGHEYIGTDDILVGIAIDPTEIVAEVFKLHGITHQRLDESLLNMPRVEGGILRAKEAIENAMRRADDLHHLEINQTHVLLGVLDCNPSDACRFLESLGVDIDRVRQDILSRLPAGSPEEFSKLKQVEESFKDHPDVVALKHLIQNFQAKKEEAVAKGKFELAASIVKQRDLLKICLAELYKSLAQ